MKKQQINSILALIITAILLMNGCKKDDPIEESGNSPTQNVNQPPLIDSLTAIPQVLDWGGASKFEVFAHDPEGKELNYSWSCDCGIFITPITNDKTIVWQAPDSSGSFISRVEVSDGENMSSQNITLIVSSHPILNIDKDSLLFEYNINSNNFTLTNVGTGISNWTASTTTDDGGAWIKKVTPSQGALESNSNEQISVEIDRTELRNGIFYGWIKINSTDGTDSVRIIVKSTVLNVNPFFLDFGATQNTLNFNISNLGSGELTWEIFENYTWITDINPTVGSTTNEIDIISVTVDRSGLESGSYNGQIEIASNGGSTIVNCLLIVEPQLNVSTNSLDFGESLLELSFNITNSGSGTLNWNINKNCSWITNINPASGSTTTETDEILISVNREGLAPGNYSEPITIESNGGSSTINCSLTVVEEAPELNVSPTYFDFGENYNSKVFSITNAGSGTLYWTVVDWSNISWISNVSPSNGTTTTGTDNFTITVDRSSLSSHQIAIITVQSNGGNQSLNLQIDPNGDWLSYDDNTFEQGLTAGASNIQMWTRFTLPSQMDACKVTKVSIYTKSGTQSFKIVGQDAYNYSNGYYFPASSTNWFNLKSSASQSTGWYTHTITASNNFNSNHFFIAMQCTSVNGPHLGVDTDPYCAERSGYSANGQSVVWTDADYGIRIYVVPTTSEGNTFNASNGIWLEPTDYEIKNLRINDMKSAKIIDY